MRLDVANPCKQKTHTYAEFCDIYAERSCKNN